jgi:ATP-dependent Clp endopeptidase proteolytic subunit ClpP
MIERFDLDPLLIERDPSKLLIGPKVIRVTSFDEASVAQFAEDMNTAQRARQPVVPVVIDSNGGDVYALLAMVDILRSSKVPVATIVEGKALSSAAVLFSCGTEGYRFMAPHATLMVHDVSAENPRGGKAEEVTVDARETARLNRRLWTTLDRNTGKPRGTFSRLAQERGRADWYIGAAEARRLGLANHVRLPSLVTSVRVEVSLG